MKEKSGKKKGLIIAVTCALMLGVAGVSFAAWGGHGAGGFMHDGGYRSGVHAHSSGCRVPAAGHGSMRGGF